mmetsp:Transcript_24399/g.46226  ORF Transcript_24399/g.46226 Transcript_24399/m.46226 type:complete len:258 (+) Transcript_24399:97-870(+)
MRASRTHSDGSARLVCFCTLGGGGVLGRFFACQFSWMAPEVPKESWKNVSWMSCASMSSMSSQLSIPRGATSSSSSSSGSGSGSGSGGGTSSPSGDGALLTRFLSGLGTSAWRTGTPPQSSTARAKRQLALAREARVRIASSFTSGLGCTSMRSRCSANPASSSSACASAMLWVMATSVWRRWHLSSSRVSPAMASSSTSFSPSWHRVWRDTYVRASAWISCEARVASLASAWARVSNTHRHLSACVVEVSASTTSM